MLNILFALQYTCKATAKINGKKTETGGDCPNVAACSKLSSKDYKKAYEEIYKVIED